MRRALLLAALAVFAVSLAFAQNAPPPCDGDLALVRVLTIKPGRMQGFLAAVAAHKAWYRNHGYKDNIIVASRVIEANEHTGAMKYSDSEVVSYHVRPPSAAQTEPKRDAAWDAYVKQYRDTSEVKAQYMTCMPKLVP
ncbi:MAG TPA: hypothetical protein VG096_21115 [Bryobacteraceae bacterium]|jgi:hypothetical protein|nr:hypothetical protein [Bryobacteraceae bacterium]